MLQGFATTAPAVPLEGRHFLYRDEDFKLLYEKSESSKCQTRDYVNFNDEL